MKPDEPSTGIFRIIVPTPYAVGPMNCYLLDAPEPVLVDCGPPTQEGEDALRTGLRALGIRLADIARIVLTHHHPDHCGGLAWLTKETTAPLLGHPYNDVWLLGRPDDVAARLAFFAELYHYCGITGAAAEDQRKRYLAYERGLAPHAIDMPLREGDAIELAGAHWQVLETPGHAGSSISLLRADGVALVGDTLLDRISSNALAEPPYPGQSGRHSSLLTYRHTMQRLAELPLKLVLAGHGEPFTGAAALIARRLQGQEERARRILSHLAPGRDTVLALTATLFPGLPPDQLFLGLSEVLGHLDILEEQVLVRHEGLDPARYSRVEAPVAST